MSHLCSPCGSESVASSTATASAASVCGDIYSTLGNVSSLRILGVGTGSTCQKFLQGFGSDNVNFGGFVYTTDGVNFHVSKQPNLQLPLENPKSGGIYPAPAGGVQFLLTAYSEGAPWTFLAAPTSGNFIMHVEDGRFILKTAEAIPGIDVIADQDLYVNEGALLCPYVDGSSTTLRKLYAVADRTLVGRENGDGERYFSTLGDAEFFFHPKARHTEFRCETFEHVTEGTGNPVTGGLPELEDVTDADELAEAVQAYYIPSKRRFYRALPRTIESVPFASSVPVSDNGAWQTMGGHCTMPNLQVNGKNIYISAMIRLAASGGSDYSGIDFGLFIDNTLVFTWDVKGAKDNTLTHLHENVTLGEHDIDIRFRQGDKAGQTMEVAESNMDLFSL